MSPAPDIWQSGEMEATLDTLRLIGVVALIVSNAVKLGGMERYTKRWDGLGRALRFEKRAYLVLWVWVLLRGIVPVLDHPFTFIAIALLIIWAEIRTTYHLPIADQLRVEMKRSQQDAREVTQNLREVEQNERDERWEQR